MIKITGLDKLERDLADAQKALDGLDGQLGTVTFNPNDSESIEAAIQAAEQMVDERVGKYANNSIIGPMAEEMKAQYREGILNEAAAARLRGDATDDE